LEFPLWLLAGDLVEIDGHTYVFRGFAQRFTDLEDMRRHLNSAFGKRARD